MDLKLTIKIPGAASDAVVQRMQEAVAEAVGEEGEGLTPAEQAELWVTTQFTNIYKRYHARVEGSKATQPNRDIIEANDASNEILRAENKVLEQGKRDQADADWARS